MQNELLIEIRLKISAGTATDEEIQVWEEWINQPHIGAQQFVGEKEIEQRLRIDRAKPTWENFLEKQKANLIEHTESVITGPDRSDTLHREAIPVSRGWKFNWKAAIIIGLLLSAAAWLVIDKKEKTGQPLASNEYDTLITPVGGTAAHTLPDGTKVWLNTNSRLHFRSRFAGNTRLVELNGEACFEVAKNEQQPFIVSTEGSITKVLGTIFNVNAYKGSAVQKISLLEGAIVISKINGDTSQQLKPGEQGILTAKGIRVQKMIRPDEATAWKRDSFAFDRVSLTDIMSELAAYYGVKVKYEKGVKNKLYTIGSTSRNVPLAKILRGMERTGGMRLKPNKDSIHPGETILILKNE
jgi:ferric-dicitrate binding protein FerR (iron transport regulator)